jgi:hypothetical protein
MIAIRLSLAVVGTGLALFGKTEGVMDAIIPKEVHIERIDILGRYTGETLELSSFVISAITLSV